VPAVCAASKPLEKVSARHGAPRPPPTKGCESRRTIVRAHPGLYGLWHCFTHSSCLDNDIVGVINRVLGEVPLPTPAGVKRVRKAIYKLWHPQPCSPLTWEQALGTFKGSKLRVYQRAYSSLLVEPLSRRDARIKAFVKAEKFDPAEKSNPDPRVIQARDPRYNLSIARYFRPMEHLTYGLRRHGMPVVAKCLNPSQRSDLFFRKWEMFKDPVCVSLDSSRWDKHVSSEMLKVEHDFYRQFYPGDVELDQLLRWQMVNQCVTSNGLKYTVNGGRMSGDMNTAMGNIILACGMVFSGMDELNIKEFEVIDDGDDILLMLERSSLALVEERLPGIFLTYGQELKIENVAFDFHDAVFCQSKITWNGERYIFARNWRKVLSQSCCGTKHWNDPYMVRPMFGLIGDCEMAQHRGIPILQAFATRLRELSGGARARLVHLDSSYQYRIASYQLDLITGLQPSVITDRARVEFEQTWGVSPSEQVAYENALALWNPTAMRNVGQEIFYPWVQHLDPAIRNPTCL